MGTQYRKMAIRTGIWLPSRWRRRRFIPAGAWLGMGWAWAGVARLRNAAETVVLLYWVHASARHETPKGMATKREKGAAQPCTPSRHERPRSASAGRAGLYSAGPRNHGCRPQPRRTPIDRGRRNVRPVSRARTFIQGVAGSPATRRGAQSIQVPDRSVTGLFHAPATGRGTPAADRGTRAGDRDDRDAA
jgi:hypothetical protein